MEKWKFMMSRDAPRPVTPTHRPVAATANRYTATQNVCSAKKLGWREYLNSPWLRNLSA